MFNILPLLYKIPDGILPSEDSIQTHIDESVEMAQVIG
jgi:hypothetical protein